MVVDLAARKALTRPRVGEHRPRPGLSVQRGRTKFSDDYCQLVTKFLHRIHSPDEHPTTQWAANWSDLMVFISRRQCCLDLCVRTSECDATKAG